MDNFPQRIKDFPYVQSNIPEGIEELPYGKMVNPSAGQGWNFVQITTGGGGTGNGNITSWVYLLFEREL
ncbi:MAG: hypothetical protein Q7U60_08525 [Candidatus Methanoperedens sp.]|nr:hypothetical protein [Candidatus Methanoperedens sp.]